MANSWYFDDNSLFSCAPPSTPRRPSPRASERRSADTRAPLAPVTAAAGEPEKNHRAASSGDCVECAHESRPAMTFYWLAAAYVFEVIVAVGFVAWVKLND